MRRVVASSVVPVGWPPLAEALANVVKNKIPFMSEVPAQGPRGVLDSDLANKNATFPNPTIFVGLVLIGQIRF